MLYIFYNSPICWPKCLSGAMRGSRNFRQGGGVQVSLTKKALTTFFFFFSFFSPQLILQKSHGQFQRNLSFFKVPEGSNIFQGGGSNFFQGESNCLFPIETHITCDFPGGGSGPPVPRPPLWIRTCEAVKAVTPRMTSVLTNVSKVTHALKVSLFSFLHNG